MKKYFKYDINRLEGEVYILNNTIDFYNANAEKFYTGTVSADMSEIYNKFEKYLTPGCKIMDCGCGSGRDSKYFLDKGYDVTPIDGSEELCKLASDLIGKHVECIKFQDISCESEYDAIWASASLLHIEKGQLPIVISKLTRVLKNNGYFYMSFKYGNYSGNRNGRYFIDLNEAGFEEIISRVELLYLVEKWITADVREGREAEKWLNVILRKVAL